MCFILVNENCPEEKLEDLEGEAHDDFDFEGTLLLNNR